MPCGKGGRAGARVLIGVAVVAVLLAVCAGVLSACAQGHAAPAESGALTTMSWNDISAAAHEIAASPDAAAAKETAQGFGFLDQDGTLAPSGCKNVQLANGTIVQARIVGVYADTAAAGGMCGLTFLFTDPVAQRSMNAEQTNAGGWGASNLRSWIETDGLALLPEDLRGNLVAASKLSNNQGRAADASAVSATSDTLWVPSLAEVYGAGAWYGGDQAWCNDVMNAEGNQYQLFAENGVSAGGGLDGVLSPIWNGTASECWTRTPRPSDDVYFAGIYADGSANSLGYLGGYSAGVLVGFCL